MKDLRQTSRYSKYMCSLGWKAEKLNRTFAYVRKIPILGNVIKIQHPNQISLSKVRNLRLKYKPFQIIIEPKNQYQVSSLKHEGFKLSKSYFVPSKTIQIDLTKSEKQLLSEMHQKTRYNIKKNLDSRFKIQESNNIEEYADFWQKCALAQRGMFLSQKKEIIEIFNAFDKNAHIILVTKSPSLGGVKRQSNRIDRSPRFAYNYNETLSGILLICTKDIAYYMYAASTKEGKQLFAPTINAWEVIKLSKKLKCRVFDFEGIYDNRFPLKSWLGFTRFKQSFGGSEIEYPGTYIKTMLPFGL